jgi:DNA-binding transcriptional regulator YiaG
VGLSQNALARLLHMNHPRTVRRWAAGEAEAPYSVVLLLLLMEARGVTAAEIEGLTP